MSVVSIETKRVRKQITFERKLIKELTLSMVQDDVNQQFQAYYQSREVFRTAIREEAIEQAMESYLLGAEYSKYALRGESERLTHSRCDKELIKIKNDLKDYLNYWYEATQDREWPEEFVDASCEQFLKRWWKEGYNRGKKRRKLRLD